MNFMASWKLLRRDKPKTIEHKYKINMKTGTVKFFNVKKGFGFVKEKETQDEIFFHFTGLSPNTKVKEGDQVKFEITQGKKGLNAVNITKI